MKRAAQQGVPPRAEKLRLSVRVGKKGHQNAEGKCQ